METVKKTKTKKVKVSSCNCCYFFESISKPITGLIAGIKDILSLWHEGINDILAHFNIDLTTIFFIICTGFALFSPFIVKEILFIIVACILLSRC